MANYKMDFITNTLTVTKDFEKKAMNVAILATVLNSATGSN